MNHRTETLASRLSGKIFISPGPGMKPCQNRRPFRNEIFGSRAGREEAKKRNVLSMVYEHFLQALNAAGGHIGNFRMDTEAARLVFIFGMVAFLIFSNAIVSQAQMESDGQIRPVSLTLFDLSYIGPPENRGLAKQVKRLLSAELKARGHILKTSSEIIKTSNEARSFLASIGTLYAVYGTVSLLGNMMSLDFFMVSKDSREKKPQVVFVQGPVDKDKELVTLLAERIEKKFLTPYLVSRVQVEGNRRVGTDAIMENISTAKGERYDPEKISQDIQSLYNMGYFDDIEVDAEDSPEGKVITFMLREKPAIRKIVLEGNHEIKDDKLTEVMDLKPYSVIKEKSLQENAEKIKALYADKGYAGTTVSVSVKPVSGEAADVVFDINEGEQVHIKAIKFEGNNAFDADELSGIMEVSDKKPW